jgi:hypothetical protein
MNQQTEQMEQGGSDASRMVRCPLCEKPFKASSEEECVKHMENCSGFRKRHGEGGNTDTQQTNIPTCNTCNKIDEKLKKCTRCKTMFYCSKECQVKDWKKHKKICKKYNSNNNNSNKNAPQKDTLKDAEILGNTKAERKKLREQRIKEMITSADKPYDANNIPSEFSEMTDEEVFVVHNIHMNALKQKTPSLRRNYLNEAVKDTGINKI